MNKIWLTVLIILFFLNLLHIVCAFAEPFSVEKMKRNKQRHLHKPCSHYSEEKGECNHILIKLASKINCKDFYCKGSKECKFYIYKNLDENSTERSSYFNIFFDSLINSIPAITTLILTVLEISKNLNS